MTSATEPTSSPGTDYPTSVPYYAPSVSPAPMAPGYDGLAAWGQVFRPAAAPWGSGEIAAPPWASAVPHRRPSSNLAVWALVTGIFGLMAGWCLLALPCIAAVVLGHLALRDTADDRKSGRGMAVAGLALGYVSLAPAVILFFWVVLGGLAGAGGAAVTPAPSFT